MTTARQLSRKIVSREYDPRGYAKPLRVSAAVKAHQWAPSKDKLPPNVSKSANPAKRKRPK